MPEEVTIDQVAPGGVVQLNDAPAALDDATFDSLFPSDGVAAKPQASQTQVQGTQQIQTQQTQTQTATQTQATADEPFLKGTNSVYKTKDAALEGINQKDSLIDQLRQRYILTTGVDPITGSPVGITTQTPVEVDYSTNPSQYLEDLHAAAKSGDPAKYAAVQQKFQMDNLKPVMPVIQATVKQQAVQSVTKEIPEFDKFYGSAAYNKALESVDILRDAIVQAESDTKLSSQLPKLYKVAYLVSQGVQLPELLKANQTQQTQQTQTQTQTRTTARPTTSTIPSQTAKPSLRTLDGIRATIQDAEARGVSLEF